MKIALFLPLLSGGGAERVMVTLANGFANRGLIVDLVLSKAEGPYLSEVCSKVRIVDLKAKRVLFSLFPLAGYLKREHPVILLSTLDHANIVALWAKWLSGGKTKCILRIPNTISVGTRCSKNFRGKLVPSLLKIFYRLADAIVVVSKYSARDLIAYLRIPSSRVHVIYNPVIDEEFFKKAAANLNHPWFYDKATPVILGVGRLSRQKDFATLIRAFALLREKRLAKLIILGEGEDRGELENLISDLGLRNEIFLPGFVNNPFPYMKHAAVFALSSRWEGLPNALIQAMALGTPIVASNCPGGSAEILEGSNSGILVPVGDEQKFADALQESLDNKMLPTSLGIGRFKTEIIISQYFNLVKSL
jgi:glycosyltransferase involved in cell wall biosynthesis